MITSFSSSYYVARLHVELSLGDTAYISHNLHEALNNLLYTSKSGHAALGHPVVMKIGTQDFQVVPHNNVPDDSVIVPASDRNPIHSGRHTVFILKKKALEQTANSVDHLLH